MGNPSPTDRRFDKPSMESLVDLINHSNKTFIQYGEIEADEITPIEGSDSALWNTTAQIRLAGTGDGAPSATMTYGRLDISQYLPAPASFVYDDDTDTANLLLQLKTLHHIQLTENDCTIQLSAADEFGARTIFFIIRSQQPVWTGMLVVQAYPTGYVPPTVINLTYDGFTLDQLQPQQA